MSAFHSGIAAMEISAKTHCECGRWIDAKRQENGDTNCWTCAAKTENEKIAKQRSENLSQSLGEANRRAYSKLTSGLVER